METKKQSAKTKATKKVAKKIVKKPTTKSKVVLASRKPAAKKVEKKPTKKIVPTKRKLKTMASTKITKAAEKVSHKKESRIKKFAYMVLAVILGLLLGFFVQLFMELVYIKKTMDAGLQLQSSNLFGLNIYMPAPFAVSILLAGLIVGALIGRWGWNLVYVQRKHRMFRKA